MAEADQTKTKKLKEQRQKPILLKCTRKGIGQAQTFSLTQICFLKNGSIVQP